MSVDRTWPLPPDLASMVAAGDSDRTDAALQASLPLSVRSSLRMDESGDVIGIKAVAPLAREAAAEVLGWLMAINRPGTRLELAREVGRCLVLTKSRAINEDDQTLMIAALIDELAAFPRDVVATALRNWARREKWWPTLAELRAGCQRAMRYRRALAIAIDSACKLRRQAPARMPDAAERAAIAEGFRTLRKSLAATR